MKTVGEILESPLLSPPVAEGERLLLLQRAADSALAGLGMAAACRVAGVDGAALQLRVADAAMAARIKQVIPSFLAAFNRAAQTQMQSVRVRVAPGEKIPPAAEVSAR